jgi:hypothetical protein
MKTRINKISHQKPGAPSRFSRAVSLGVITAIACSAISADAIAGSREQAKRIYDRIAGVPPSDSVLTSMATSIDNTGNGKAAAAMAMDDSHFYSVTLKNFAMPWTNRDQTVFAPLNDYVATFIGMVRDDVDFSTALSADLIYTADTGPAYSNGNNDHYQALEDSNADLKAALKQHTQSSVTGLPAGATAGLITTRAAAQAFFVAGTNRAMFRFTMINHMCRDMEQVQDTSRPPDRIRQDVSRSPGGDSRIFLNSCIGCHSGMDPMAQAFAFYDFDPTTNSLKYTGGAVQPKYLINSDNFKTGFVTPDDSWENRWRAGPNSVTLGFSSALPGRGAGAKSLGDEFGHSDAFADCQVQKVFRAICFRSPATQAEDAVVQTIKSHFTSGGYKLKQVFAEVADYCKGD